jgi:hypothetical protein
MGKAGSFSRYSKERGFVYLSLLPPAPKVDDGKRSARLPRKKLLWREILWKIFFIPWETR